jgi:hypothetical protein
MAESRDLIGWKEIARHLGVSEKTARRAWMRRGLPVEKTREGRYFASTAELDAWRERATELGDGRAPTRVPASVKGRGASAQEASTSTEVTVQDSTGQSAATHDPATGPVTGATLFAGAAPGWVGWQVPPSLQVAGATPFAGGPGRTGVRSRCRPIFRPG